MTGHSYNRAERERLDVLRRRLDYLRSTPAFVTGEHYTVGEARALGWALDILEGTAIPMVARLQRLKGELHRFESRLAEFEHDLYADLELPTTEEGREAPEPNAPTN